MSRWHLVRLERGVRARDRVAAWPVRAVAWALLIGVTGFLVRAESRRPLIPPDVRLTSDLVYREVEGRRARLDVYRPTPPAAPSGYPVLVAIHGGGWRGGSKGEYGRSLLRLVHEGVAIVAVDYALSRPGEPSWPENRDDVRAAVAWVHAHAGKYGLDPNRIALIGASAGAHLALSAAEDLGSSQTRVTTANDSRSISRSDARIKAVVDFYGPADLASLHATSPGAAGPVEWLIGGTPASHPDRIAEASPARRVRPGGPPVLIVHGTEDLLVPPGQSQALAEALRDSGSAYKLVMVQGARHGFGLEAGSVDFVPGLLEFLRTAWED